MYSARHVETQRRFALKRVRFARLADTKEGVASETIDLKETAIALSLGRHKHAMALEYCVVDGSEFLMFLEFIDGASDLLAQIRSGGAANCTRARATRLARTFSS